MAKNCPLPYYINGRGEYVSSSITVIPPKDLHFEIYRKDNWNTSNYYFIYSYFLATCNKYGVILSSMDLPNQP